MFKEKLKYILLFILVQATLLSNISYAQEKLYKRNACNNDEIEVTFNDDKRGSKDDPWVFLDACLNIKRRTLIGRLAINVDEGHQFISPNFKLKSESIIIDSSVELVTKRYLFTKNYTQSNDFAGIEIPSKTSYSLTIEIDQEYSELLSVQAVFTKNKRKRKRKKKKEHSEVIYEYKDAF